jgi:hypothetical protein
LRFPGRTLSGETGLGLLEPIIRLRHALRLGRERGSLIQVPNKGLRTAGIRAPSKHLLGLPIRVRNQALHTLLTITRLDPMAGEAR